MAPSRMQQEFNEQAARFADTLAAIRRRGADLLRIPGVIAVEPGFKFVGGEITDQPAVRVLVMLKRPESELEPGEVIPRRLDSAAVDVVMANPRLQYRHREEQVAGPAATDSAWRIVTDLPGQASDSALAGPTIPYVPPAAPLEEVNEAMTVVCHSSVDSGWRLLSGFFQRTRERLVSTMYEFTADYIFARLVESLQAPRTFEFIFDGKKKDLSAGDVTPTAVTSGLQDQLGDRFTFAWAANAQARQVTAGFFPSAYHIKVSVRDQEETWLSSGNWKPSGQPAEDPFMPPAGFNPSKFRQDHNREWHVLVENKNIAQQFERFIRHDIKQALPLQVAAGPELPERLMPDLFVPLEDDGLAGPPVFQPELVRTGTLRVLPLLTPDPDSYFSFVKQMIAGAQTRILFENQSLAPRTGAEEYMNDLFLVLRDKCRDENLDVRIIVRGDFDPQKIKDALLFWKFPMERVRLLRGVHTKGIIVDDATLLLGSHNWTSQGTRENRDASLVFWDPEIIQFYTRLFESDWSRAPTTVPDRAGPRLAGPGESTPPGFVRVPWSAFHEDE